jgi:hypothetical protein
MKKKKVGNENIFFFFLVRENEKSLLKNVEFVAADEVC